MLFPLCKFAFNSTHFVSIKHLLAFVVFGCESNLSLELAVHDMTDS